MKHPSYHPDNEKEFATCIKKAGNNRLPKIKSQHYQLKFIAPVNCDTPEEAFRYLENSRHPLNFGNPILESDIIVTPEGAYAYLRSGIIPVVFDETKAMEKRNLIRAVAILPGLPAFETRVDTTDKDFLNFFGGASDYITLDRDLRLFFHRGANASFSNIYLPYSADYRVINGPCIITKGWFSCREALSDKDIEYCLKRFSTPVFSKGLIFGLFDEGFCSYDDMATDPPDYFEFPEIGDPR